MKMENMLQSQKTGVIVQDIVLLNLEKVRTDTHFSKNSFRIPLLYAYMKKLTNIKICSLHNSFCFISSSVFLFSGCNFVKNGSGIR